MNAEDLELLRRAAKAAGVSVQDDTDGTLQARPILVVPYHCHGMMTGIEWNPLRDDGTAFALAADNDLFAAPEYWHYLALARLDGCTDKRRNVRVAIVRMMAARCEPSNASLTGAEPVGVASELKR